MTSAANPSITFINRFTVHGDVEAFEAAFATVAKFMAAQPGIVSYTLSRHADEPNRYVNLALWRDVNSLRAAVAHPHFKPHVGALRQLASSESDVFVERQRYEGVGVAG